MKISFDVYTKDYNDALEASRLLEPVCVDYRVSKSENYSNEINYNVYGTIDSSYASILSDFPSSFSEDC